MNESLKTSNQPEVSSTSRPKQVALAVGLLWVSYIFKPLVLVGFLLFFESAPLTMAIAIPLTIISIYTAIVVQIYRGKNWARIVALVMFVFLLSTSENIGTGSLAESALIAIQFSFQLIALSFLFFKPGTLWFRAQQ